MSNTILSAEDLPAAEQLFMQLLAGVTPLLQSGAALVGIRTGGAWLSTRICETLQASGCKVDHGILDSSFYRDDFKQRGLNADTKPSQIGFEVSGRDIVLVDDVLFSGRTIRAAMNELFDYGRPASIHLAVLANRGGLQLPIAPQTCPFSCTLPSNKSLKLRQDASGQLHWQLMDVPRA